VGAVVFDFRYKNVEGKWKGSGHCRGSNRDTAFDALEQKNGGMPEGRYMSRPRDGHARDWDPFSWPRAVSEPAQQRVSALAAAARNHMDAKREWPFSAFDASRGTRGRHPAEPTGVVTSRREAPAKPTAAEREVADLLPIEADPDAARAVLDRVPLWFHTFSLDHSDELYTPGVARDHRYRIPALPEDFSGTSVLDVGTFDGFYAFLAEARGARRVVAVDNEQYRVWVQSRWGVELEGGEGFTAIRELLRSKVEYRRLDAFDLDQLEETFDFILCFGILHRVDNPMGLLKVLRRRLSAEGRVLLETYGSADRTLDAPAAIHAYEEGEVYARDDFVYWGFTPAGLEAMACHADFEGFELIDAPVIDGHPRVIGTLRARAARRP
jgi:tRNA (mo5U34)-methyltransferase